MARPTVHDIAKNAGVSLATVDRVLNKRPGVKAATIEQVNNSIVHLGYVRDVAAANLARNRTYKFVCILPDTQSDFLNQIRVAVSEYSSRMIVDRTQISTLTFPLEDTNKLVGLLAEAEKLKPDGVAIMAPETPSVRDAVRRLIGNGITVTAIVSDLPNTGREHFVGINNKGAGRTAAKLLGRFLTAAPSKILVIAGSMASTDHAERRTGFDATMLASFPQHTVLPTLEAFDNAETVYLRVGEALQHHPEISGIYSIGAGNAGLVKRLAENNRCKDVTVIAHELTEISKNALLDGTFDAVISQNAGHIVRSALRILKAQTDSLKTIESQERIRTEIFIAENLL